MTHPEILPDIAALNDPGHTDDHNTIVTAISHIDDRLDGVEASVAALTPEQVQILVATFLQAGTNVTLDWDENAGSLTISATGTDTMTREEVEDLLRNSFQGGSGLSATYSDEDDLFIITNTDRGSAAVSTHNSATTGVHGVADTSLLVGTSDGRLSDARTPTAHAASHGAAGPDPATVAQSQVTSLTTDLGALDGRLDSLETYATPSYVLVRNATGATLTKGTIVYTSGANGDHVQVTKALATSDATSARTLGFTVANIPNGSDGYVIVQGYLTGLNTSSGAAGSLIYLSGTTAGGWTTTKPVAPIHYVGVGVITRSNANNGSIFVKVQNGYELDEIHDVLLVSEANGDLLKFDSATGLWKNAPQSSLTVAQSQVTGLAAALGFKGTGFPEGVVAAPVGSIYTDTAATNGAIRWIKATGVGNTGWRVEYGDTGWRNIESELSNGYTSVSAKIRRFGNQVSITLFGLNGTSSTNSTLYTLPAGFSSDSSIRPAWISRSAADQTPNAVITYSASTLGILTSPTLISSGRGSIDFLTSDAWPATLPGTA